MAPFTEQITFLSVADLERSSEFYGDTLGLELVLDQADCRIYRVAEAAFVGVCARAGAGPSQHVLVTLVTDDVDGWHERLVAADTPCDQEPAVTDAYGIHHAFYRDPDGHRIEVQRFLDPDWADPTG